MVGREWKNTMAWKVIDTLNGVKVTTVFNGVELGSPRGFDNAAQARAHIEHEQQVFATVQREITRRVTEQFT